MTKKYEVEGWAAVMFDGFLPDITHPTIGAFHYINTKKKSAEQFVNKCNKDSKEELWKVVPAKITYEI